MSSVKDNIHNRSEPTMIVAGLIRLIDEPKLLLHYAPYISKDSFYKGDQSDKAEELRGFVEIVLELSKAPEKEVYQTKMSNFIQFIRKTILTADKADAMVNLYNNWRKNEEIVEFIYDQQSFDNFIRTIQRSFFSEKLATSKFSEKFQRGEEDWLEAIQSAVEMSKSVTPDEHDFIDASKLLEIAINSGNERVATFDSGLKLMDELVTFEAGSLTVVGAPSGTGKSTLVQNLIYSAVQQKIPIWVGVLEEAKKQFARRMLSRFTGITLRRFKELEMGVVDTMTLEERDLIMNAQKEIGQYVMVRFIYGTDVDGVHLQFEDDQKSRQSKGLPRYEVCVTDYSGHVAYLEKAKADHVKYHNAFAKRKNFALKHSLVCWDFLQFNREAVRDIIKSKDERLVIDRAFIAGGFDVIQVIDNFITMTCSHEDYEKNQVRFYIDKGRDADSERSIFALKREFSTMTFSNERSRLIYAPKSVMQRLGKYVDEQVSGAKAAPNI